MKEPINQVCNAWTKEFPPYQYFSAVWRNGFDDLIKEHELENVLEAVKICGKMKKPNMRYLAGILRSKQSTGYDWPGSKKHELEKKFKERVKEFEGRLGREASETEKQRMKDKIYINQ